MHTPTRRGILFALGAATLAGHAGWAGRAVAEDHETAFDVMALQPGEFTWHPERQPEGPVAVIVSIPEQRVHDYRNGVRIGVSTCSTGREGHATPTGVFTVLQKDADHRSSTYNNAPMPNMNRLTWDGIALHAGNLPGYPASHGCVRLPMRFSELLFEVTHIGTPVIISGNSHDPWELVHPGLVLTAFAEDEMEEAVAALETRSHPADWGTGDRPYPVTTVLASAGDGSTTLMEEGREVLKDRLEILDRPDLGLGEHVLVLSGAADGHLRWHGLTHHHDPAAPLADETHILDRVGLTAAMAAAIRARLHPGLVFIVTDLPTHPDRRSGADFTIMASAEVSSPRPPPLPERLRTQGG